METIEKNNSNHSPRHAAPSTGTGTIGFCLMMFVVMAALLLSIAVGLGEPTTTHYEDTSVPSELEEDLDDLDRGEREPDGSEMLPAISLLLF